MSSLLFFALVLLIAFIICISVTYLYLCNIQVDNANMVSTVLASVLQSYLGQYLELSDTSIAVGSQIQLDNVKLKESAFSALGLPVKCVHGKVAKLVIKIPWLNLFTKKTSIEVKGLHLLVVPSTAVRYDEAKERKELNEAKQKRLERTEQAKQIEASQNKEESSDTFVERLVANIIKNLEVTVSGVHLRYEDKQSPGSGRYPFAAGVTLRSVLMTTMTETQQDGKEDGKIKLKVFKKHVELDSLAFYWKPKASLYSEKSRKVGNDDVSAATIDSMFNDSIGTRENPSTRLKYLLGPISSDAMLEWCPNPLVFQYTKPQIDLRIQMRELCVSLTKYQYQDFVMLLESFEFMSRAANFRRYKAKHNLENLPNYGGRLRDVWKFAYDCVMEEEVMRKRNNWTWEHMRGHIHDCKRYRQLYKQKLTTKVSDTLKNDLRNFEDILDEVNIRIQRQLAEREVEQEAMIKKEQEERDAAASRSSGFWGWFYGKKSSTDEDGDKEGAIEANLKKFSEALTQEEKAKLYEVIDYQENAHHGIFPKSFVARKLAFTLDCLVITIRDDDLHDAVVVQLLLNSVTSYVSQRPAADFLQLDMQMKSLTVTGMAGKRNKGGVVTDNEERPAEIVKTRPGAVGDNLVNFSFENNPPSDPDGDLDTDEGSLYDQRLRFFSSPLEITYDARTINQLISIFRAPEDLNLANLQHTAATKLKEYRQVTTLGLQYVIENHNLVDVDIELNSSYVILPHGGELTKSCACAVANLGSIRVKSKPISAETRSLKEITPSELTEQLKHSLLEKAYDKFNVSLENMQLIVALPNEEWRSHIDRKRSPLFLLEPTSLRVTLQYCLIKNDPEMPLIKLSGSLKAISVNISDYRLIKLAQIVDSLFDQRDDESGGGQQLHRSESEVSMQSALSSLPNTGSLIMAVNSTKLPQLAPIKPNQVPEDECLPQVVKVVMVFSIGLINLSLTQQASGSNEDQKLFHFIIKKMDASARVRPYDICGEFKVGGVSCEHLLLQTPSQQPVRLVSTAESAKHEEDLLQITYTDVNRNSPEFRTVHGSVLKKVDINFSAVHFNLHQDAILDLINKITKFVDELSSNTQHLIAATTAEVGSPSKEEQPRAPNPPSVPPHFSKGEDEPFFNAGVALRKHHQIPPPKRLNRSISIKTTTNFSLWASRAKKRVSLQEEAYVDFRLNAVMESVTVDLMTSKINFAHLKVRDVSASYQQTKTEKVITAKLFEFKIQDPINSASNKQKTFYENIAENMDKQVFDAQVTLYDHSSPDKAVNPDLVDVKVKAEMGRVKVVFLMKFIRDLLDFLDPFTGAKKVVAERANLALEGATKSLIDAYANATRALLDIKMEAPLIIVPVHSTSTTTFIADLGTLRLSNRFSFEESESGHHIFDHMHFLMQDLQLCRSKIHSDVTNNEVLASCIIIHPITFELDIKRNMNGAKKKEDPAELKVTGQLHQIAIDLSKGDYDVMMAVLLNNFQEKGAFQLEREHTDRHPARDREGNEAMKLSLKSRQEQRASSRSSLISEHSVQLQSALNIPERDPEARAVEFNFKFLGFLADLYSGETSLEKPSECRSPHAALARVQVKVLAVQGHVLVSSAVVAKAYLQNCLLEDNRFHGDEPSEKRVVRLLEAKQSSDSSAENTRMIDIDYFRDSEGSQQVEVTVYSFILVGSVPYLLEIANFFVQDQKVKYEWHLPEREVEQASDSKMSVFVLIEEPDIFLIENIEDVDSEAVMLNTKLQFHLLTSGQGNMDMMASLTNVRCHTCRFNPKYREETLAQILQPCTLSFNIGQTESRGLRINANISDLCLNISPHGIITVQKSVQAFLDSMAVSNKSDKGTMEREVDHTRLWSTRQFDSDEFWFLRPEESIDAVEVLDKISTSQSAAESRDERATVNINTLVVKIESGVGNNTIPMLLLESSFNCTVCNWSGPHMSAIGSADLEVAYYNPKLALWEPVIEPVCQVKPDGTVFKKPWDVSVTLQSNAQDSYSSAFASPSFDNSSDVLDGFCCPDHLPPAMVISLQSREILEVTITKTFIGALTHLTDAFAEVTGTVRKDLPLVAPFILRNDTGKKVTILLDHRGYKFFVHGSQPGQISQLDLHHGNTVELFLFKDRSQQQITSDYVSPLQEQTEQAEATMRLRVSGETGVFELPVSKADRRFFPFPFRGDEMGDHHGMISEVSVDNGCKYITLRSIVQIKNHFERGVNVYVFDGKEKYIRLASLAPDESFNVPLSSVYSTPYEFHFQIDGEGQNLGLEPFNWRRLIIQESHSLHVRCTNKVGAPDIFLNVKGMREEIFLERTGKLSSSSYVLDIRPLLVVKNCLPVTLHYGFNGNTDNLFYMEAGGSAHMQGVCLGTTFLTLKIFSFRETDWTCSQLMEDNMPELGTWRFVSDAVMSGGKSLNLDLNVNTTMSHGTQVISIYAPFWMVNKTGKMLTYRGQDPLNIIYHPVELESVPLMFSYTARSAFMGKRKASLRIEGSAWSEPFTLDTIEDAGKVSCKRQEDKTKLAPYSVGVNIAMSKSSLTKIITFTPFYITLNTSNYSISIVELTPPAADGREYPSHTIEVPPGESIPFWPRYGADKLVAFVTGTSERTSAFSLLGGHSSLLKVANRYGAIQVDCRISNSETLLTLSSYSRGLAPVQLINSTRSINISYWEKSAAAKEVLKPSTSVLFTWTDPSGPRALIWSITGYVEEYENALVKDGQGVIELEPKQYLAWVSFLDGMQRILLFAEDPRLCYSLAHTTGEFERIELEVEVSMHGVGVSVVNNSPLCSYELLYTSVTASEVVWETRPAGKTRYRPLTRSQCVCLESDFQTYSHEKTTGKRTSERRVIRVPDSKDMTVNYSESRISQPHDGRLRRQFQHGLWLQFRTSVHQRQLHVKIHRIQIDNQLRECLFPVIMASVPPPKSVLADSIPKPFLELSVLEYTSPEHTQLRQYKYIHVLVQELHIKVDIGLINAFMDLFEEEEILDEDLKGFLKEDLDLAAKPLQEIAKLQVTKGQKDFYDYLHLSPLKVHVSFSFTSYKSSKTSSQVKQQSRRSNSFSLFLQSLGVTMSDTDDIIFRLAYFERKHMFYSQEDLFSEMIDHYTSQAIKQLYVVIFGLDVIGNPYGLVVGVSRSVEDLFYEPFQGAVEGPSEFAEGLVIGVRSVFSGVVGGAAGTFSRITGALGKGLASLTFDEKFQNKRREAIKKRGRQTLGESFVRSGRGLVMGIVDGVTGVAVKPITGAKEEGMGGFFKGVGKGMVGLVARPTGGLVDFASGTFDSVKRATEVTEATMRVRPARFLHPDGVVRNYNFAEATGNKILAELDKGRYVADALGDVYVTHSEIGCPGGSNEVFMVTTKRVLSLNKVLGSWNVDWEFEYAAITGPPPVGKDDDGDDQWYLIIKPRVERKVLGLFSHGETGKKILVGSRDAARRLARTIEDLRTSKS